MWIEPCDKDYKKYVCSPNFIGCGKCGKYIYRQPKRTIFISMYDKHKGQYQRKLCSLCMDCYTEMLEFLEVPDIR